METKELSELTSEEARTIFEDMLADEEVERQKSEFKE